MKAQFSDERFYFVWLSQFLGVGSDKVSVVFEYFKSPKAVYEASDRELLSSGIFSKSEIENKEKIVNKTILEVLKYSDQNNIRIVGYADEEYPECLRRIENPPALLFVRGVDLREIFPTLAIVGSRKPTEQGKKAAFSVAAKLSLSGFTVVSGGALGIDKMAHLGAFAAGGKTVLVLGCGIDSDYLKSNEYIRKAAEQNGAVISEFLPKASATRYSFPIRNRIISALSSGVIVVEAARESGALITATYAMEQGRDVFAVPGDISLEEYEGNNQLIKDGATVITSIEDILSVYEGRFGDILKGSQKLTKGMTSLLYSELEKEKDSARKKKITIKKEPDTIKNENIFVSPKAVINGLSCSVNAKKILLAFDEEVLVSDIISVKSKVDGADFIAAITELELKGYIKAVPVGRYKIQVLK